MASESRTFTRKLDGEHVISEADGRRSRDQITLAASATKYEAGEILGQNTTTLVFGHLDLAANNGLQIAAGVLFANRKANAAAAQKAVAHTRDCELNGKKVTFPAGFTTAQKRTVITQLGANGVLLRETPLP